MDIINIKIIRRGKVRKARKQEEEGGGWHLTSRIEGTERDKGLKGGTRENRIEERCIPQ